MILAELWAPSESACWRGCLAQTRPTSWGAASPQATLQACHLEERRTVTGLSTCQADPRTCVDLHREGGRQTLDGRPSCGALWVLARVRRGGGEAVLGDMEDRLWGEAAEGCCCVAPRLGSAVKCVDDRLDPDFTAHWPFPAEASW